MRFIYLLILISLFSYSSLGFCKVPPWQQDLEVYQEEPQNNKRTLRTIIHMHSVYSHDACDNKPYDKEKKRFNEDCVQRFRQAFCRNHIDAVFLTDHKKYMAFAEFDSLLNLRDHDEPIVQNGRIVGSLMHCPNNHQVLLFPGAENRLMPIGFLRHPDAINGDLYSSYAGYDKAAVERFRQAGALVALPHIEELEQEQIVDLKVDLLEIYNVHANLNMLKELRNPFSILSKIYHMLLFFFDSKMTSDLYFFVFFDLIKENFKKWAVASLAQPITAIIGSDSHENVTSVEMPDKERIDGHRRILRWYSNFVEVKGDVTRESIMDALKQGRVFMAYEISGTPNNFKFIATADGKSYEMGSHFKMGSGVVRFHGQVAGIKKWYQYPYQLPEPKITLKLLRATPDGWDEIAINKGHSLQVDIYEAGVYRLEAWIEPLHLEPYLNGETGLIDEVPWVYSNPIWVE